MSGLWRKLMFLPPVALGAAALVFAVVGKQPPAQAPAREQARLVRVIDVQALPVVPRITGYGSVVPGRVFEAVAQVAGKVDYVAPGFEKGEILQKGARVIGISKLDYELAIREATANIRATEAKLGELEMTRQNTQASLEIEKRVLAIRQRELERKAKLARRQVVSDATLDAERRGFLAQRKIVQELENALRLIPTQIAAQKAALAVHRARLENAKLNLRRTDITLPFDARVASKSVEVTQFVAVGQKLGRFDGMKTAEIEVQIPQIALRRFMRAVAQVRAAQGAEEGGKRTVRGQGQGKDGVPHGITAQTIPRLARAAGVHAIVRPRFAEGDVSWRGRLVRISDSIDAKTRTVGVIVAVDDVYAQARPGQRPPLIKGMFVEVELRARALAPRPVLPRSALHNGRVYVVNRQDRLEIRRLRPAFVQGDIAVIAEGLAAGEKVVVSDLTPAIAGQLLKTVEDRPLTARLVRSATGKGGAR